MIGFIETAFYVALCLFVFACVCAGNKGEGR